MAFDASVIADIGGNTPDVSGSQAKALTLADLYDRNALSKIEVSNAKQGQSDMTYAKQILAGKDLSKLDDQNAAVAQITKRSPKLGMELARDFSSQRQDKSKENLDQLDYYKAKNEILGADLLGLKAKHDEIQAANPKATEQQIHDAMQKDVLEWVTRTSQQTLPNGQPLLNEQDKALIRQGLGQGYSTAWVNQMVQRSAEGRAQIAAKLKERDEARKEKQTDAMISLGSRRADQGDRKISDAEQRASAKEKLADESKLGQDDVQWMAEQYWAGDKSVMVGLGRGAQGPQNIIAVRHAIAAEGKRQGATPADLAARLAEYQGYVAEQRTLGTSQANVQQASSEAKKMIENARTLSAQVPRSEFLPWTKLSQMTDKQLNDPKLVALKGATTEVINTWARAINPKGVATVSDKDHGYELLNQAQSQEAYNAQLEQFETAINASLAAPPETRQYLHDVFVGKAGKTGQPSATETPAPTITPPAAGGSVLRFDAQGNPMPPGPSPSGAPAVAGTGASTTTAPALDVTKYALAANDPGRNSKNWDKRADGSSKGQGFLGLLKRPDGKVSSEISVGVQIDGKEVEVPTMVPTLTQSELDWLLTHPTSSRIPDSIVSKAVAHARQRISAGKSPFAQMGESPR